MLYHPFPNPPTGQATDWDVLPNRCSKTCWVNRWPSISSSVNRRKKEIHGTFTDALEKNGRVTYCDLMDGLSSLGQEMDIECFLLVLGKCWRLFPHWPFSAGCGQRNRWPCPWSSITLLAMSSSARVLSNPLPPFSKGPPQVLLWWQNPPEMRWRSSM